MKTITLTLEDANNILSMLNEAIEKLSSGTRSDDDVEVFGVERSLSYERLIDAIEEGDIDENEM